MLQISFHYHASIYFITLLNLLQIIYPQKRAFLPIPPLCVTTDYYRNVSKMVALTKRLDIVAFSSKYGMKIMFWK